MSEQEIRDARSALVKKFLACNAEIAKTDDECRGVALEYEGILLKGMSVALQWVCRDGGSTLQDLLDGRTLKHEGPANG